MFTDPPWLRSPLLPQTLAVRDEASPAAGGLRKMSVDRGVGVVCVPQNSLLTVLAVSNRYGSDIYEQFGAESLTPSRPERVNAFSWV